MTKWLIGGLVGFGALVILVVLNWGTFYEELVVDPIGVAKLSESIAASPCADHRGEDTTDGWRYDVNYTHCFEIDSPLDWSSSQQLDHPEYQALISREFADAGEEQPYDYDRWDGGREYTLEITVYGSLEAFTSDRRGSARSLDEFIHSNQSTYHRDPQPTTLGAEPAFDVIETGLNEAEHEVVLCEYRGKIVLIRIGAGEFDKGNRPHVDRAIASFRFLPEFGTQSQ